MGEDSRMCYLIAEIYVNIWYNLLLEVTFPAECEYFLFWGVQSKQILI